MAKVAELVVICQYMFVIIELCFTSIYGMSYQSKLAPPNGIQELERIFPPRLTRHNIDNIANRVLVRPPCQLPFSILSLPLIQTGSQAGHMLDLKLKIRLLLAMGISKDTLKQEILSVLTSHTVSYIILIYP